MIVSSLRGSGVTAVRSAGDLDKSVKWSLEVGEERVEPIH